MNAELLQRMHDEAIAGEMTLNVETDKCHLSLTFDITWEDYEALLKLEQERLEKLNGDQQ